LGGLVGAVVGAATGNKDMAGLFAEKAEQEMNLDRLVADRTALEEKEKNKTLDRFEIARLNQYRVPGSQGSPSRGESIEILKESIKKLDAQIEEKQKKVDKLMDFSPDTIFKDELKKLQDERAKKEAEAKSPVKISSDFGERAHPMTGRRSFHEGVDLLMNEGDNVYAAEKGTVKRSGSASGYGNMIEIDHGNGKTTRYGHLKSMNVAVGDMVERGQKIALAGNTGTSTNPHLHFEERENGQATRPSPQMLATAVRGIMLNDGSRALADASRSDTSPSTVNVVNQQAAAAPQQSKPQNAVASTHNFDPWVEIWSASILNPARMGM